MTIQVLCMKPEDFVCLPRLVRDYLNYLSSVKGKSQLTVCEYASDLRLFFAYMLKQENLSQYKNTPIDEIDISKLDIDFISLARIPTAYGFWNTVAPSAAMIRQPELAKSFLSNAFIVI